jgi:hypothetical protein
MAPSIALTRAANPLILRAIMKRLIAMKRLFTTCLLLCLTAALSGQSTPPSAPDAATPLEALEALSVAIQAKETEAAAMREQLQAATNSVEQEMLASELEKQLNDLRALRQRFEESASGVDVTLFQEVEKEAFSWQNQLGKILQPIIDEMEAATARSRQIGRLRRDIEQFGERQELADKAITRIRDHLEAAEDPVLEASLQDQLGLWEQRRVLAANQARAAAVQLEAMEAEDSGGLGGAAPYIRGFLSQRGLNLLYGIGSAILVFMSLRLLLVLLRKLRKGEDPNSFSSRVFVLFTNLLSIIGAIVALLIVFSAAGDLFLLGLVLIFLIGAAWAGIQVIPQFIESLKIILNIGMVKENQRIVFDGIPWNVAALGFSCRLVNKELDDGLLLLPVKRLVGLHSRPWCKDEVAFPVKRNEWVALSDGKIGCSVAQNPGTVSIKDLGGAIITYPTPDFLNLAPRNLSRDSFRVQTRFGIDYAHQADSTTRIPEWFKAHLEEHLPEEIEQSAIRGIYVQFASAGASSLDYEIEVDLDGSAAPLYERIEYALQRLLVDACNAHNLTIPFSQITVHQAG